MHDRRFPTEAFPEIVAHRGASATCPENTVTSFEEAVRVGARIVEFDVRLTREGIPVVMHDPTVDRTTDGTGAVADLAIEEIAALRIAGTEHVPTLTEVLERLSGRTGIAIEIKNIVGDPGFDPTAEGVVRATHSEIERIGFEGPVLVLSFDPQSIAVSKVMAPDVATGFLTTPHVPLDAALEHAAGAGHDLVLPGTHGLLPDAASFVERAHAAGVHVGTWTADDPEEIRTLLDAGVDAIASNDPATALGVLRER